jgi:hypothetical protein
MLDFTVKRRRVRKWLESAASDVFAMLAKRATRPDEGALTEIERVRDLTEARDRSANVQIGPSGSELNSKMKDGLYSVRLRGFDGVDWPPGGVAVLQNGVVLGGGPYTYYTGSYSSKDGTVKGELILKQHTLPPRDHVFFNAKDVGIGVTGSYKGDQAELTGTALVGKRCLTVHVIMRKLADA